MLAEAAATALLAVGPMPPVLADAAPAAILAPAALPTVRTGRRHDFPCTPRSACLLGQASNSARALSATFGELTRNIKTLNSTRRRVTVCSAALKAAMQRIRRHRAKIPGLVVPTRRAAEGGCRVQAPNGPSPSFFPPSAVRPKRLPFGRQNWRLAGAAHIAIARASSFRRSVMIVRPLVRLRARQALQLDAPCCMHGECAEHGCY